MKHYIYHIVIKSEVDNVDVGYIGVTKDFNRRKMQHFTSLATKGHINYKLQDYFEEHKDNITMYVFKEFDTEEKAYRFEATLRPHANIGLNIASGGKKEYQERFESKNFRDEHKSKGFFGRVRTMLKAANHSLDSWAAESVRQMEYKKAQAEEEERKAKPTMTFKKTNKSVLKEVDQPAEMFGIPLPRRTAEPQNRKPLSEADQKVVNEWLGKPFPSPNGNNAANALTEEEAKALINIWAETPKRKGHAK